VRPLGQTAAVEPTVLGRRGRIVRLAAVAVAGVLLLFGTWKGEDDGFPFGPFKMYAGTQSLDSPTSWIVLVGETVDGRRLELSPTEFGVRRGEIEGRLDRIRTDPSVLAALVRDRQRQRPHGPALLALDVVERSQPLKDGRPDGAVTDDVVAHWSRA
jgi:hypothetical protein